MRCSSTTVLAASSNCSEQVFLLLLCFSNKLTVRGFSYRDHRESLYVTMTALKEGGRGGKYYRCIVFEIRALQHQLLCFPVRSQLARCSTRVRNGRDPGKTLSGGRWEREEERAAKRLTQEGGVLGRQPKLYGPIVGQPGTVCEGQQGHFPTFKSWK